MSKQEKLSHLEETKPLETENVMAWAFLPHKDHIKHKSFSHALFSWALMIIACFGVCTLLANYFAEHKVYKHVTIDPALRNQWAIILAVYYAILLSSRLALEKSKAVYDMLWACNICILLSIYALIIDKPILIGASLITISCDQILWYADILSYIIFRKFKIGVAAYLLWPEVHLPNKITSTHHLWFMPVLGFILKGAGGLHIECYYVSVVLTSVLWIVSRSTVPRTISGIKEKHETYMNVNLSWELWKDVKVAWLANFVKDGAYYKTMAVSMILWNGLNFLAFLLLASIINWFTA